MANLTVTMASLVKNTTKNLSILMTCKKQVIEEEALSATKKMSKIRKLVNKRSNLIGCAGVEAQIKSLTDQINALRAS